MTKVASPLEGKEIGSISVLELHCGLVADLSLYLKTMNTKEKATKEGLMLKTNAAKGLFHSLTPDLVSIPTES